MRIAASLVTVAALGCGAIDSREAQLQSLGTIRGEVVTVNGVDVNGVDVNGVDVNGVDVNGVDVNGVDVNGVDVNGVDVNGVDVNGIDVNGSRLVLTLAAVHLAGAKLNGAPLTQAWLEAGELRAQQAVGSVTLAGTDLVGASLDGELSDGRRVLLSIQSAALDAGTGVWRYDFVYQQPDGTWAAVCPVGTGVVDAGVMGAGVVVSGRWNYWEGVLGGGAFTADPNVFTIGCLSSAVGKCVRLGYRPWAQFGTVPGVELHTSCVRAIRADYCGDGRSHTTNGRLINIYDGADLQMDMAGWAIEAEWTPWGATCVSPMARDVHGITCAPARKLRECGDRSHFETGTRLMTEAPTKDNPPPAFR